MVALNFISSVLMLFAALITFLKPKSLLPSGQNGKDKLTVLSGSNEDGNTDSESSIQEPQPKQQSLQKDKKPKPTRAQLGLEIGFDLLLTRLSLMIDIISQTLVLLFSAPAFTDNHLALLQTKPGQTNFSKSQALFVAATSLTSFGSGAVPAIHSLALCLLQVRGLDDAVASSVDGGEDASVVESKEEGNGVLFGAFAVLHTVGQMFLGVSFFYIR